MLPQISCGMEKIKIMTDKPKMQAMRQLFLIATPKTVEKVSAILVEKRVPFQYRFWAEGTATREVRNVLGLESLDKNCLLTILPRKSAEQMLRRLEKKLHLGMPGTGIAFTIPITSGTGRMFQMLTELTPEDEQTGKPLTEGEKQEMEENKYSMIMAIVDHGYSEDVMQAARLAGATGGTVLNSRRCGSEEAIRFWGISVQEEREILIILAGKDEKLKIMEAIGEKCGMQSKAHGVVFSMPVDSVVGMD